MAKPSGSALDFHLHLDRLTSRLKKATGPPKRTISRRFLDRVVLSKISEVKTVHRHGWHIVPVAAPFSSDGFQHSTITIEMTASTGLLRYYSAHTLNRGLRLLQHQRQIQPPLAEHICMDWTG